MKNTSLIFNVIAAIEAAHTMDNALEALDLAEALKDVAFTQTEIDVARAIVRLASDKVESFIK